MGNYLSINSREICSKSTSYLMGSIIRDTIGNENHDGDWMLYQKDIAALIVAVDTLSDLEKFTGYMRENMGTYWASCLANDPERQKRELSSIFKIVANTLADMVLEKEDFIFAIWI